MSTIDRAFINTFEGNVRHLVQQKEAKLFDTVQIARVVGKDHSWDRLGTMEADIKNGERVDTNLSDAEWSRRVSLVNTYDAGTTTEQEDITKMLVNPNSNLSMVVAASMKRKQDDVIIEAATGNALDGLGASHALPAGQIKDESGNPLDLGMVADIQTMFMDNHIDPDVEKYAVIPPSAVATLMKTMTATSADYVQANALQQYGVVKNWMGFNWRTSTRLLSPTAGNTGCLFYTKQAIGMQLNADIRAKIAEAPTKSFMWIIYAYMVLGAVRIEDEQLIQLKISSAG